MTAAARQPLNLDAADLRAAREFQPLPLRDIIDYYRSRVLAQRQRLDESLRYDAAGYRPPHARVGCPEVEGQTYRHLRSVLHHLLRLYQKDQTA